MEKDKLEAYQRAVGLLETNAHPDQRGMADDMVELAEADPETYVRFVCYQLTEVISALISSGQLQPMGGSPDETEH